MLISDPVTASGGNWKCLDFSEHWKTAKHSSEMNIKKIQICHITERAINYCIFITLVSRNVGIEIRVEFLLLYI